MIYLYINANEDCTILINLLIQPYQDSVNSWEHLMNRKYKNALSYFILFYFYSSFFFVIIIHIREINKLK